MTSAIRSILILLGILTLFGSLLFVPSLIICGLVDLARKKFSCVKIALTSWGIGLAALMLILGFLALIFFFFAGPVPI